MRFFAVFLCLFLSACATGTKVDPAKAQTFVPGQTTQEEIIAALGQPQQTIAKPDGTRSLVYSRKERTMRPEYFIPLANYVVGGVDDKVESVNFDLDQRGVLKSFSATEVKTCSEGGYIGLVSGNQSAANCKN